MSDLTISEKAIQEAAMRGVTEAVRAALSNSYGGSGSKIQQAINEGTEAALGAIRENTRVALVSAVRSEAFAAAVATELARVAGQKLAGAFTGALIGAGKAMANDPSVVEAMRVAGIAAMARKGESA